MARMGVFSRNDDTPEHFPKSVQMLTHRKTFDAKYMEIYPNFVQTLQPGESLKLQVTNFLRSMPMVTPQLSRVRVVQRFYAVPYRIMWQPWEDWIKGENDAQFLYELPYLANCNFSKTYTSSAPNTGIYCRDTTNSFRFLTMGNSGYFSYDSNFYFYLLVGNHELGDYLGYPKFTVLQNFLLDGKKHYLTPNAFEACAYQLAYSFGYRAPNVQSRVDDFRQLAVNSRLNYSETVPADFTETEISVGKANQSDEFPPYIAAVDIDDVGKVKGVMPVPKPLPPASYGSSVQGTVSGLAQSSDRAAIVATSWDKVEHFPLRAGANVCMLARDVDTVTGLPKYVPSNISLYRMRFANWQTDYFTSSNPWQQRGDESLIPVQVSESLSIPVFGLAFDASGTELFTSSNVFYANPLPYSSTGPLTFQDVHVYSGNALVPNVNHVRPVVKISAGSYSDALTVSPSAFRFAMALQHVKELEAQTDGRYKSYLRKIFGVSVEDNRIDRPEFIGGSVQELNVTDVVQTSESTDSSQLGDLAGRGTSAKTSSPIRFFAREHTIVIGMLHIVPDTEYINGLTKEQNVHDRFDFPIPQFANLSEQPVYGHELVAGIPFPLVPDKDFVGSSALMDMIRANFNVFGYEPVYNNLRWRKNEACGAFSDVVNATGNSEFYKPWIITRDFGFEIAEYGTGTFMYFFRFVSPTLSDEFLSGRYGVDYSNFNVTDPRLLYPFIVDSYFDLRMTRIIPNRGIPSTAKSIA